MKTVKWKPYKPTCLVHLDRKDEVMSEGPYKLNVNAYGEKLYVDQSEKGGFMIARVPEDASYKARMKCKIWLKTSLWADNSVNTEEKDEVIINYAFSKNKKGGLTSVSSAGEGSHFIRLAKGYTERGFELRSFFEDERVFDLNDADLKEKLKKFVLEAYEQIPAAAEISASYSARRWRA